jgi:polyribonucleotide nucleotidyltransferase
LIHTHTFEVGGKSLSIESGRVAGQAGGAVLLGMGETVVFGAATMSQTAREGIDFLPLTCDYEERKYAVGKIPGGFIKRGGRPGEKAVLTSRLIDRPLRPLFPKGLRHDVQVVCMPFAVDQDNPSDVLAIVAAGAALAISDIPFAGPVAGVRVSLVEGVLVLFPTVTEYQSSELDLVVAGHRGAISMVEAGASEVSEGTMIRALEFAHGAIRLICDEIDAFAKAAGKPKREVPLRLADQALVEQIARESAGEVEAALVNPDKVARESALGDLSKELTANYAAKFEGDEERLRQLPEAVDKVVKDAVRRMILDKGRRPDGRAPEDLRALEATAGILPRVHGSGLFSRGQTQVMTVLTLGMPSDAQILDGLEEEEDRRYMHFYNFPPYSVGETRPMRGPGRREVGHGALAERALRPVVPLDDPDFPYTCMLTSEVLESNGSTSMAAVCGSTLALMDGGVPIKAPVAGIAMGLMSDGKVFKVLTDIQGIEDFCGDMDFKVAGTRQGITALQLDTKLDGIPDAVLAKALEQARQARLRILDRIEAEIPAPRPALKGTAPLITTVQISPDKIGAVIGPGGATIRRITNETGAQIDVQQDGRVLIAAADGQSARMAADAVRALTASAEVGAEFRGKVTRLMGRGAMVEFLPGKEGLVPIDHLCADRPRRPDDVVSAGDEINVKVHEIDAMGRVNLTALGLPQTLPALAGNESATPPPPGAGAPARGGRPGGDRGERDRDRGYRGERGGDRDRDRGFRGDRDRDRDRGRPQPAPARREEPAGPVEVPEAFPKKPRADGDGDSGPRFRPRR